MLELARLLCGKHSSYQVWITFFDGEEAMKDGAIRIAATEPANGREVGHERRLAKIKRSCWRT